MVHLENMNFVKYLLSDYKIKKVMSYKITKAFFLYLSVM